MANGSDESVSALQEWDPTRYVRKVDPREVLLSRGFLRSRPERWFPGLAAQWIALSHALGVEIRAVDVRPVVDAPAGLRSAFAGTVDGEPVGLFTDRESEQVLVDAVIPDGGDRARGVVVEYFARRLLATLALSWSGAESSSVRFSSKIDPFSIPRVGGVKLVSLVNGRQCTGWITLGPRFVERLDGLWRRQMQSSTKIPNASADVHLEVAQLAVPPSMLVDYMRSGTVIDLEVGMTDTVTLRMGTKPWLAARICEVQGRLGIEILSTPVVVPALPEGTTRVAIELGMIRCDPPLIAELAQAGSMYDTGIPLSDHVQMVINNERVANARLKSYEGRFAISVA